MFHEMIKITTIDAIDVSKIKPIRDLYDELCKLKFCTPDRYWADLPNIENLFLFEPMFVRKVGSEFELIAGFRTFYISLIARPPSVHAYDISDWTEKQQVLFALESTSYPLLLWATKNAHAEANIHKFLNEITRAYATESVCGFNHKSFKRNINRHQGRKLKLIQSSLQKTIEMHCSKGS